MADRVVDDVWWLHGTRGSNVFLIDTKANLLLVDSGFPGCERAILEEVASVLPGRSPDHILLTHAHRDHSGSARELQQLTGATLVAGAADTREARPDRWVISERRGPHQLVTRAARLVTKRPVGLHGAEVTGRLEGEEEVVPGITAVPVPGHTAGSYCFVWDEREIAFVGDLVIAHPDTLVRPMALTNSDDHQYLESLAAFAARSPLSGCPGHGAPVLRTFAEELQELAGYPRRHFLSPSLLRDRATRFLGFSQRLTRRRTQGEREQQEQ